MKNSVLKRGYSLTAVLLPRLTFWPQSPLVAPTYPSVAQPLSSAESCAHLYPSHDLTAEQLIWHLRRFATQQFRKQNLHLAMAIWPSRKTYLQLKFQAGPQGWILRLLLKISIKKSIFHGKIKMESPHYLLPLLRRDPKDMKAPIGKEIQTQWQDPKHCFYLNNWSPMTS